MVLEQTVMTLPLFFKNITLSTALNKLTNKTNIIGLRVMACKLNQ